MQAALRAVGLLLAVGASGASALIVLPAPSKTLALAAIVASERSAFLVAAGMLALLLAFAGRAPQSPLAPIATAVLAAAAIAIAALPLAQARRVARERGVALDAGAYLRARIDSEGPGAPDRTVPYATVDGGRVLSLDVYLPAGRRASSRAIVVAHGGFWAAGERGEATLASRRLANLGFTVFDVDYRLAPQPNWQAALGDLKCAVGWVKQHAADYLIDPAQVVLLGRSAGGHLALMAAYTPGDRDLPASCATGDTAVSAVIALYPPTDLAWAYAHPGNLRAADSPAKLRAFLGDTPEREPDRYRALSPAERVTPAAPPTLVAQGGRDQMVPPDQMDRLVARLRAAGVRHDALFIPYAQHAFDFVPGSFSSQLLEDAMLRFLGASPR
ncbi:MAG TPA: alpha/beta hydrolase [Polyangia bacterium]|nr:alpha/beta hydrolase [Polyangia bacterium]